ncbi:MAG: beta-L-arabinofuranosidase domain-containing protein [Verrucomicrobiota bacterium]
MNARHLYFILLLAALPAFGAAPLSVPCKVAAVLPDAAEVLSPADVQLEGWLGDRVLNNERSRLATVDLEPFLAGFRQKPGTHPWIGEHIGKWMHAATLAWVYTGDPELRKKLDYAAGELIKAQEADGYLGTYVPELRFGLYNKADWDVWSHKYCLIGLLTYYQYTGNEAALEACRKAGDLLVRTFGPDRKSILSAGTHMGMAATSVLEPMVLLYRFTGDKRYLDFSRYIVQSWNEPGGPRIIDSLLAPGQVNKTANGKAYEMLSNLVGLCELARVTGDRQFLVPVLNAWSDITSRRLYLTGTASQGEFFKDDDFLPNGPDAHVGEACVTVTWIQINSELLRLTGEARFGEELERSFYNSLTAAQHPNGDWVYFTPLEGAKFYDPAIKCCHSSGPRGLAMIPQQAYFVMPGRGSLPDTLAVNLFEKSHGKASLRDGVVGFAQQTDFPRSGEITLWLTNKQSLRFAVAVRAPAWAMPIKASLATKTGAADDPQLKEGWLVFPARAWKAKDRIRITLNLRGETVAGTHMNQGRMALKYGPFVLAYDEKRNPAGRPAAEIVLKAGTPAPVLSRKTKVGLLEFQAAVRATGSPESITGTFVPFADAGLDGGRFQVWIPLPAQ